MVTGGWGLRATNLSNGIGLGLDQAILQQKVGGRSFLARIYDYGYADADIHTGRWRYGWNEMTKTAAGYGELGVNPFDIKKDGRSGTAVTNCARNFIEVLNSTEGLQGNGINLDGVSIPAGFDVQPVPIGTVVLMHEIDFNLEEETGEVDAKGNPIKELKPYLEYWFAYENAFDGSC